MEANFQEENYSTCEDQFDRLPDAILRLIFNQVRDAQSLCRCIAVSKRFSCIVPEIDNISLKIPRKNSIEIDDDDDDTSNERADQSSSKSAAPRGSRNFLKSLINKVVARPIQLIRRVITAKSSSSSLQSKDDDGEFSYHSPGEALKRFNEIRFLQVELPSHGGEIRSNSGGGDSLLKWKAEFGSELESCVLLGATSFRKIAQTTTNDDERRDSSVSHEQADRSESCERCDRSESFSFTDDDLKLRVIWTISCLIASSARHHLFTNIVSDHPLLRSVEIADRSKQGRLVMREDQIEKLRKAVNSPEKTELASARTRVPALKMKMWYAPVLELPESGFAMEGATLVLIRPADRAGVAAGSDGEVLEGAFDGDDDERALGEAVREMVKKKKTYTLEMNSF